MEHDVIPAGKVHAPHNWRVADAAERLSLVVGELDLGKYLWQLDDDSEWFLSRHSPVVWTPRISNGGVQYTHTQAVASDVWTVNHNLGYRPAVSVLSVGGRLMLAEVLHTSVNQTMIYFDSPTPGQATCS